MVTESIMELLYMMEEAAEGTEYVAGIEKVIDILNDYEEYEWDSMRSSEKKYYVMRALKNEEADYGED